MPAAPQEPLYTLRWTCPRCHRTRLVAQGVPHPRREPVRRALAEDNLHCGRCGGHWAVWECGIDWQPENEAARHAIDGRQGPPATTPP